MVSLSSFMCLLTICTDLEHLFKVREGVIDICIIFVFFLLLFSGRWGVWRRGVCCERWLYSLWPDGQIGLLCYWHGPAQTGTHVSKLPTVCEKVSSHTTDVLKCTRMDVCNCVNMFVLISTYVHYLFLCIYDGCVCLDSSGHSESR